MSRGATIEDASRGPTSPEEGKMPVTVGTDMMVSATPLLVCPLEVTVTGPVWAPIRIWVTMLLSLQKVEDEETPLNETVPLVPNPEPLIVIVLPITPAISDKPVMIGNAAVTVNVLSLRSTLGCKGQLVVENDVEK